MVSFPKISPNLLLGVGGIIAAVFLVSQIRKAGADVQDALSGLQLPDISLPDITFPEFPTIDTSGFDSFVSSITDIFKQQQDTISSLAGQTIIQDGTTITIPPDTIIDPITGIVTSVTPPTMDLAEAERLEALRQLELNRQRSIAEQALAEIPTEEDISGAELTAAINEAEFIRRQQEKILAETQIVTPVISPEVVSLLPTEQQFIGGGTFIGGTIRENPIDTLSEVLSAFPQLTASQASDFLSEFSGILPSELQLIDPDIKNIVAAIGGESVQVGIVGVSDLEAEAQKAAIFTCKEFGLNCELVDSMMA